MRSPEAFRAAEEAERLLTELSAVGTPERAAAEKAYLKSELPFLGVTIPAIRARARAFRQDHRALPRTELLALVEALWRPVHEARALAIALLELYVDRLEAADLALVERWLREVRTWAHVDWLTVKVAGPLVEKFPALAETLDRWAADPDFWVRRSALLALLDPLKAGAGDFPRFERLASGMLDEREFFIRKAIGWVLREVSKRRPALSFAFLSAHRARVAGLTLREGAKYLAPDQRRALGLP